jgi:hypothetical protein
MPPRGDAVGVYEHDRLVAIELSRDVLVQLRPAAKCREMSVQRLAVTLLETIAREHLADAVLDDQA